MESRALSDQEIEDKISQRVADAATIGLGIAIGLILATLCLTTAVSYTHLTLPTKA